MNPKATAPPAVLSPGEAAARLGVTTAALVALLRRGRYKWTELALGGRPGDRGRNRWGLTVAQLETIIRGQERCFAEPIPDDPRAPRLSSVSPDGISRLRRGPRRPV